MTRIHDVSQFVKKTLPSFLMELSVYNFENKKNFITIKNSAKKFINL